MRVLFAAVVVLVACDTRNGVFEPPDPSLARMLSQRRADPYEATSAFPDGKVMREPVPDTVARDDERDDERPAVTRALLVRGRARYDVVCAACHGVLGDGVSVVAEKMEQRKPPSLHEKENLARTDEDIHAIVMGGYGLMPSCAPMLPRDEAWAVVAYVRALQLARRAPIDRLPPPLRARLEREAPR